MSKPKKKASGIVSARDAATTLATAAAGAVAAVNTSPTTPPATLALAAVLVALFPAALSAATEAGARRFKARNDAFLASLIEWWARDESITPQEVLARLETRHSEANLSDAIWRSVRALMETPNDSAALPLAMLVAEYRRHDRTPDAFFRGVVRLLSDASREEVAEIRALIEWALASTKRTWIIVTVRDQFEQPDKTWVRRPWRVHIRRDHLEGGDRADNVSDNEAEIVAKLQPVDGERLLFLLYNNGLARRRVGGGTGGGRPPEIELERGPGARLANLLRAGLEQ